MASEIFLNNVIRAMSADNVDLFTFVVEDGQKTVKVLKTFLRTNSDFFAAKFDGGWTDAGKNDIELPDVKYEVMSKLVEFIYVPEPVIANVQLAFELFKLADEFQITSANLVIYNYMAKNTGQFTDELALKLFIEAERRNSKQMVELALQQMVIRKMNITKLVDYDSLTPLQAKVLFAAYSMNVMNSQQYQMNVTDAMALLDVTKK